MTPAEYAYMKKPGAKYASDPDNPANMKNGVYSAGLSSGAKVDPMAGSPLAPKWQGLAKTNLNKLLGSDLQNTTQLNTQALDALRGEALRTGPSAWRGMAGTAMGQRYAQMGDQLAQQQAGQQSQALGRLAMTGGLRGGSAERIAGQGATNALLEKQRMARQRAQESTGLDIQDEANRQNQLGQVMQGDLAAGNFASQQKSFNIQNALQEMAQKRGFDAGNYAEKMKAWAAQKTAEATPSGGKK